jgi:hypothetical protein
MYEFPYLDEKVIFDFLRYGFFIIVKIDRFEVVLRSKIPKNPIKRGLFFPKNYLNNTDKILGYMIQFDVKIAEN